MTNGPFPPGALNLFQLSPLEWQARYRARLALTQGETPPTQQARPRHQRGRRRKAAAPR